MHKMLALLTAAPLACFVHTAHASDQCNTTRECQNIYPSATDCLDSRSDQSVCMCGSVRCDAGDGGAGGGGGSGAGTLGRFDPGRDILLCNYDGKPDEDDLLAVAGLATILSDARFAGIDYHCTAGAYGRQGGQFLDEPNLFDLALGRANWSNAHFDWAGAVTTAATKAMAALQSGGDVWIAEAGQSDFSADVVRRIRSEMPQVNTRARVHIVQHSDWNERQTTASDLRYVRSHTDYRKIGDGNKSGNGTPDLNTRDGSQWPRATSDRQVGEVWTEARAAAQRWFGINWDNDAIKAGGFDFSDTVEVMYIFGLEGRGGGVTGFFDEFLSN